MQLANIFLYGHGLVALASSTLTNTDRPHSITGPTFWENTQTHWYHCKGKDIIRCETTSGDACIVIDACETYCFLHDVGVSCVTKSGLPFKPEVPVPASEAQENEHYECSNDRTGVLVCRWGFCSTDHYCKAGDECRDSSFFCAPKSLSVPNTESEPRDSPTQIDIGALGLRKKPSYTCSKDRASVLKCLYSFCATDYYCAKGHPCIDKPARCKKAPRSQTER